MYDNMPTSESYNHLNIIITDLVVNLENEEKYEIKLRTKRVNSHLQKIDSVPEWRTPHMKGVGMLVGNFELNPKGDRSVLGPSFFDP